MKFDLNISETVSLSKILDVFIEDAEDPSVIIAFLEQYGIEKCNILQFSTRLGRLFSAEYISRCTPEQISTLFEYSRMIGMGWIYTSTMFWQSLKSNIGNSTKEYIRGLYNPNGEHHPYSGKTGVIGEMFDSIFFDVNNSVDYIISKINSIPPESFERVTSNFNHSLWADRILQMDIFINLTADKQYLLVYNTLEKYTRNYHALMGFMREALAADINVECKYMIYQKISSVYAYTSHVMSGLPNELVDLIDGNATFPELKVRLDLMGSDMNMEYCIFYVMSQKKYELMKGFIEFAKDELKAQYNVVDILEYILEKRNEHR